MRYEQIGAILFSIVWVITSIAMYRFEDSKPRWLVALGSALLGLLSAGGLLAAVFLMYILFGLATGRITG